MGLEHLKPHQFKPGQSGNPSGRPKGGLKEHDRRKFSEMSAEDKDKFLATLSPEVRYKMAEGNPHQTTDEKHEVRVVVVPKEIDELLNENADTKAKHSNQE